MATLAGVIEALLASREHDSGAVGRFQFWVSQFGDRDIATITADEVDAALMKLAERGRLRAGRGKASTATPTGKPLSGATINRYLSSLASVYKFARQLRLLPRGHLPPTRGVEKAPEPVDPHKYFRPEEVERLIKVARVVDHRWRKLPALIVLGFQTGLRRGNLMALRWRDIDLEGRTATVERTKNGHPHVAALTERCVEELRRLPKGHPDEFVFAGRNGRPYHFRKVWDAACTVAGLEGRTPHWLRHGCGSALASAGVSQAQIMQVMGHRTLIASARYMHSNVADRRAVVDKVFA